MQIRRRFAGIRQSAANSLYALTPIDRVEEPLEAVALHDLDES